MRGWFVGYVAGDDPLHDFLSGIIRDRLGVHVSQPAFRAFRLSGSNEVYGYEEKWTGTKVVGKFYGTRFGWDRDRAARTALREYQALEMLRGCDLIGSPHHVVRPLGFSREINAVLVVEYCSGEEFSDAIRRATEHRDDNHLYWRLTALAYFLATLHDRTVSGATVDFDPDCRYFDKVVGGLWSAGRIGQWDVDELRWLRDCWRQRPRMWQDREVCLHGDATPANFLFGDGLDVIAIDLERMKRGDRMFDVGRVAGELQHMFLAALGDWRRAEPFVGHFLWEYSGHFPHRELVFDSITARAPFYLALTVLRVARNDYVGPDYAGRLVARAKRLLQVA